MISAETIPANDTNGDRGSRSRASLVTLFFGACWLVAMTVWYLWTAASTLDKSFSRPPFGDDRRWLVVIAICCLSALVLGGLIALQFIFRHQPIVIVSIYAVVTTGIGFVVLRHQMRAMLVAIWMLVIAYVWGNWLLIRGGIKASAPNGERVTVSLSVGLVLFSGLVLTLGLAGWLRPGVILSTLIALTVLQHRALRSVSSIIRESVVNWRGHFRADGQSPERSVIKLLLALIALYNLAWALAPETSFDALNYQLAVPRFYLENGAIVDLPYFWHSYFARLVNSILLVAMSLGGQTGARLIILSTGLIAATGVYLLARSLLSRGAGLWAAALFYSTPLVSWLSTVAYVDLTVAMFVITSWLAFLRWLRSGGRGWLIASGVLAGAVIGAKPNGAYALPVMGVMLLWITVHKDHSFARFREVLVFITAAVMIASPWYWLTWRFTGNPVFPLLNGIFKSPYWEPVNEMMNAAVFGVGRSPASLLRAPFALTFDTYRFDEVLPSGGVGLALVLLPLGFFRAVVAGKRARILFAVCLIYLLLWAFTFQYARYYIPILPIVTALSVIGVVGWGASGWPRRLGAAMLWVILLTQCLLIPTAFAGIISRNPMFLMTGRLSDEQFLGQALAPYWGVEYLNRVMQPDDWVVGNGVENVRYYLRAPLVTAGESAVLRNLLTGATEESLAEAFDQNRYRYLFVNRAAPGRSRLTYLKESFLDRFATLEYRYNSTEVYRLYPKELERSESPSTNLVNNAGFEHLDGMGRLNGWIMDGKTAVNADAAPPHGGQRAVCLNGGEITQRITLASGGLYTLSTHARSNLTGRRASARLRIDWLRKDGTRIDATFETFTVDGDWRWLQMVTSVPVDAMTAEIALAVDGARVCFDDIWFGPGRKRRPE